MSKAESEPAAEKGRTGRVWACLAVVAVLAAGAVFLLGPRLATGWQERAALGRIEAGSGYGLKEDSAVSRSALAPSAGSAPGTAAARAVRKILYTATLRIEVKRAAEAAEALSASAEALGGYVQSSSVTVADERGHHAQLVLRVPAARLQEFIRAAGGTGRLVRKELDGQDVTEEYVDLEARLRNWQNEERRYLAILAQAKTVAEVLAVQAEIGRVRESIEQIQGKMRYYDQHAELATVTVSLFEEGRPAGKSWFLEESAVLGRMLYASFRALLLVLLALAPWTLAAWAAWRVRVRLLPKRKEGG